MRSHKTCEPVEQEGEVVAGGGVEGVALLAGEELRLIRCSALMWPMLYGLASVWPP